VANLLAGLKVQLVPIHIHFIMVTFSLTAASLPQSPD
jgi:hypothetical protein